MPTSTALGLTAPYKEPPAQNEVKMWQWIFLIKWLVKQKWEKMKRRKMDTGKKKKGGSKHACPKPVLVHLPLPTISSKTVPSPAAHQGRDIQSLPSGLSGSWKKETENWFATVFHLAGLSHCHYKTCPREQALLRAWVDSLFSVLYFNKFN